MKNEIVYPDYNNSILEIPNSILKYCGVVPKHKTSPVLDEYLKKDYKNVIVMLFDGMGIDCIQDNLPTKDSIFHANKKQDMHSVFLCTTTAATTSMRTALSPIEHGWLGWSCYFKELDKLVNIFMNDDGVKCDGVPVAEYDVARKYMPYKEIFQLINEQGNGTKACSVSRFGMIQIDDLDGLFSKTKTLCNDDEKRFIYTYWGEPDHLMHVNGCYDYSVKEAVVDIQKRVEKFTQDVEDTLIIVTADHGLLDSTVKVINHYPEINDCLRHPVGLEPRCNSFYIKDGMIDKFVELFKKEFGDQYILFTKDEFIKKEFLGPGKPHPKSYDFLGDIIAVAVGDIAIWNDNGADKIFKALHAGMTEKEMMVPLIVLET